MTKPDDRAQDAQPEVIPDDEALVDAEFEGEEPPDDAFDDGGEDVEGEDEGPGEDEVPAAVVAPTRTRAGRESATSRGGGRGTRGKREPAVPERMQTASDIAVHVDDRASAIFVIGVIGVFALIFLYAVLLGKGGILTPLPTRAPIASPAPVPSASAVASAGPSASASPTASASASASPSASASSSVFASPSASPSAGATATPSPTPKPTATPKPKPTAAPSPSG
jgi:hypothetical protein